MRTLVLLLLAVSGAVANEEENPYAADGDSTQECYAWAADGQCVANPGFMRSSCKYSCWEWFKYRKEKFPDAPIDKRFDCNSWASNGECHKNTEFMKKECPESCKEKGYDAPEEPKPVPAPSKKKKKKGKKKKAAGEEPAKDEL